MTTTDTSSTWAIPFMTDPEGNILWRLDYHTPVVLRNGQEEKCSVLIRSRSPDGSAVGLHCWRKDKVTPILKHPMDENTEVFAYDQKVSEQTRMLDRTVLDYTHLCFQQRKLVRLEEELSMKIDRIDQTRMVVIDLFELVHGFPMPSRYLEPAMTVQLACSIPEFKITRPKPDDEVQLGYFIVHWTNIRGWKYFQELVISDSEESIRSCLDLIPIPQDLDNQLASSYWITDFRWYGVDACPVENPQPCPLPLMPPFPPPSPSSFLMPPFPLPIFPPPSSFLMHHSSVATEGSVNPPVPLDVEASGPTYHEETID